MTADALRLPSIIPDRRATVFTALAYDRPFRPTHRRDTVRTTIVADTAISEELIVIPVEPSGSGEDCGDYARGNFEIEDVSVGAHAHGFGRSAGKTFAFRVRKSILYVEVYRDYCERSVPSPDDVIATAERSVRDIDLTDVRSISAVVRDAVASAEADSSQPWGSEGVTTLRAVLDRLGAIIDSVR